MAGGINPFGFGVGAAPVVPRRMPQDIPAAPFGFAAPPTKWQRIAPILNQYNPIDAFWRLYDSPMAKGGPISDQNIEDGFNVAGTAMAGSLPIRKPPNSIGVFGGMYAKTADHVALQNAQKMAAEGADAATIRDSTGWFKGADQKWRFEIPDTNYVLLDENASTVGDKVTHPKMFNAYPELSGLLYNEGDLGGAYGQYWRGKDADTGELLKGISTDSNIDKNQRRSTVIHELQHAIQDIEGFEPGSNPVYSKTDAQTMAMAIEQTPEAKAAREANLNYDGKLEEAKPLWRATSLDRYDRMIERPSLKPRDIFRMGDWYSISDKYRSEAGPMPKKPGPKRDEWLRGAAQAMKDDYIDNMSSMDLWTMEHVKRTFPTPRDRKNAVARLERQLGKYAGGSREWMRINDKIKELQGIDSFDAYKRSVGETEARNVQSRLNMTPEELKATAPWKTQEYPFGMQIPRNPSSEVVRSILNYRDK